MWRDLPIEDPPSAKGETTGCSHLTGLFKSRWCVTPLLVVEMRLADNCISRRQTELYQEVDYIDGLYEGVRKKSYFVMLSRSLKWLVTGGLRDSKTMVSTQFAR